VWLLQLLQYLEILVWLLQLLQYLRIMVWYPIYSSVNSFFKPYILLQFDKTFHMICKQKGNRGHNRMVIWFTTTCAIIAYDHYHCEFGPHSWRGVLDTTLWISYLPCFKQKSTHFLENWFTAGNLTENKQKSHIFKQITSNTIKLYKINKSLYVDVKCTQVK
jgi:hypothetical protein